MTLLNRNSRRILVLLFVCFLGPFTLRAQYTARVITQANLLAEAVLKSDYNTIVDFTYPAAIDSIGGREKMLKIIDLGMKQLKEKHMSVRSATFTPPEKFYTAGVEIHCLIPEAISLNTEDGIVSGRTYMLGISKDGGANWTFLELSKKTMLNIRKMFPHFNPELKLPISEL